MSTIRYLLIKLLYGEKTALRVKRMSLTRELEGVDRRLNRLDW